MISTQRHLLQPADVELAARAFGIYETPVDASIRAIFTRQQGGNWRYCSGQCLLGTDAGGDGREDYPEFSFVSRVFHGVTLKKLLESLAGEEGLSLAPDLPSLRLPTSPPNWREEVVPSHATTTGMPARRLRVAIESNAVFSESQLIAYDQPYRPSAERYAKAFLRLTPRDGLDRGEFTIEVPERRGAISFRDGCIRIARAAVPVRLVGEVDGRAIDLTGDQVGEVDNKTIRVVELWLLAKGSELIDYISTTHWPYKYAASPQEAAREEALLTLIRGGESEVCEFKPWVDLNHNKASELEKTVCAFSNQRGGTLFIGVSKEGDIDGIAGDVARRGDGIEAAITAYADGVRKRLRETLKDNQCFDLKVGVVSGTSLIVVTVEKSCDINFIVKSEHSKTAFIRHGATSMKLTPPEMKAMIQVSVSQTALL